MGASCCGKLELGKDGDFFSFEDEAVGHAGMRTGMRTGVSDNSFYEIIFIYIFRGGIVSFFGSVSFF